MAVYDVQEREQLDDLKAWWARWGNAVTIVVVIASAVAIGVQGWRWYTTKQADEAGAIYGALTAAARGNDLPRAKEAQRMVAPLARFIYNFGEPGCAAHQRMKVAKWLLGEISSPVFRRPVRPMPEGEVQRLREGLNALEMATVN